MLEGVVVSIGKTLCTLRAVISDISGAMLSVCSSHLLMVAHKEPSDQDMSACDCSHRPRWLNGHWIHSSSYDEEVPTLFRACAHA